MSLLMDALKQAEAKQGDSLLKAESNSSPELALAPDPAPAPAPAPAAPRQPTNANPEKPPPAPRRSPVQAQAAARTLFEAKQTTSRPRALYLALGGLVLLFPGVVYIAWKTLGHHGNIPALEARQSLALAQTTPLAAAPLEVSTAPPPPTQLPRSAALPSDPPPAPTRHTPTRVSPARARPASTAPATPAAPPGQAMLDAAHATYSSGNLMQARRLLLEAREQAPLNTDIHLALGMIALRNAEPRLAEQHFRTLLEIDPAHAPARSQILLLHAAADPQSAETRLRQLLAEQPESADALFALGSLFAGLERWQEAQQAFFKAHVLDGGKPDTLYNLAVSLDNLQQAGQARHYYQQALARSSGRAFAFDPDAAHRRVTALAPPTK